MRAGRRGRAIAIAPCRRALVRWLGSVLIVLGMALPVHADPFGQFDPDRLTRPDARLLQAALSFSGHYVGQLDGDWGQMSDRALRQAVGRDKSAFAVMEALLPFLADIETAGWRAFVPKEGTSVLLPEALLLFDEGPDFVEFRTPDRSLIVRYIFRDGPGSGAMHDWLEAEHIGKVPFYRADLPEAFISHGQLDQSNVYLRTRRIGDVFETVLVQWNDAQARRGRVIVASLSNRPQSMPVVVDYGYFAALVDAGNQPTPSAPPENGAAGQVGGTKKTPPEVSFSATGSGFFVNATDIVTAAHVVDGCTGLRLADGSSLQVLATNAVDDLAILTGPKRSRAFLEIADDAPVRIGAQVTAVGYPYASILGQGLTATGGNISALRGLGGETNAILITAPIQPGNSGGPLIDSSGRVIGVVVAQASTAFVLERSGTLPQNLNQATTHRALLPFLEAHGVVRPAPSPEGLDLTDGLPDRITDATVLITCDG